MVPEAPQAAKKTRDLPNLSECHNCGHRINTNNPKDRLQTLNSEWRVILLCRGCLRGVESSQLCAYCFAHVDISKDDFFRCRGCSRCVHKGCVCRYECSAPWSYLNNCDASLNFGTCVDCWLPKEILKSRAVLMRKVSRKRKFSCIKGHTIIRVSNDIDGVGSETNSFEGVGKGGNDKVEMVPNAREKAVSKADVGKGEIKLEKDTLDMDAKRVASGNCNGAESSMKLTNGKLKVYAKRVASRNCNSAKRESELGKSMASTVENWDASRNKVVDDAELALRLHRTMNSSPRILKNLCPVNSSSLVVSRSSVLGDDLLYGKSYSRKKQVHDKRSKFDAEDDRTEGSMKEEEGSCSNNSMVTESFSCRKHDGLGQELQINSTPCQSGSNGHEQSDRFLLKYNRRNSSVVPLTDRKYSYLYDKCCLQRQASDAATVLNCSNESRSVSEASFQSCDVPLQTAPCASGSSQYQS